MVLFFSAGTQGRLIIQQPCPNIQKPKKPPKITALRTKARKNPRPILNSSIPRITNTINYTQSPQYIYVHISSHPYNQHTRHALYTPYKTGLGLGCTKISIYQTIAIFCFTILYWSSKTQYTWYLVINVNVKIVCVEI